MQGNAESTATLDDAVDAYLEAYFRDRDYERTLSYLTNTMTGFGTAEDENGYDHEISSSLYRRDFEQAPEPVEYTVRYRRSRVLSEDVGLVSLQIDLRTVIMKQSVHLRNLRMSMVFLLRHGQWLLEHMHVSLPTTAHGPHESYPVKELEDRATVLARLVEERTRELEEARRQLERQATTDSLTSLYNRGKAEDLLRVELARAVRSGATFSVILIDIDHFKRINDSFGHQVGDDVLRSFARLLSSTARETDIVARWGGEEFLITCPGSSLPEAMHLAERLRKRVDEQRFRNKVAVTASVGVTQYASGDGREALLVRADVALYRAKEAGRNRVASE